MKKELQSILEKTEEVGKKKDISEEKQISFGDDNEYSKSFDTTVSRRIHNMV